MKKQSAGVLPFRVVEGRLEVLLVHPGGPFWAKRDLGAWSIAKGELDPGEEPMVAAIRELREETGWTVAPPLLPLGSVRQKSGKVVHGFAAALDVDPATLRSNTFPLEWPKGSGIVRQVPEVDRAAWFDPGVARSKMNPGQVPLLDRLEGALRTAGLLW